MYTWIPLASSADLSKLASEIPREYAPDKVARTLANGLSDAVKAVLIEQDYIDKDYRSTYYGYYSKKGQAYRPECVRLHFFDGSVSFNEARLHLSCSNADEPLAHHYFGYMVLRPTGIATIGRTVLSPDIRSGARGFIISANHKSHVLGERLTIEGFPSMDQHIDIAVCAHVACWSILRHYSERYAIHQEFLTHDITLMAHEFDPGGLLPSKGLEVSHAERVFQNAGTFPLHVARGKGDIGFYRQLGAYLESGFPLFAAMQDLGHAVVVVGHEWENKSKALAGPGPHFAWEKVKALSVVDDNDLPYLTIPAKASAGVPYSAENIDAFIVALPEKIFYPADAIHELAPKLYKFDSIVKLPPKADTIIRYFITTGSALRHFVRERESEFPDVLLQTIMQLPFAQFVWIVEFASQAMWSVNQVSARAVIDATASVREDVPLWLLHNDDTAVSFDRRNLGDPIAGMKVSTFAKAAPGFTRIDQNLRPTRSK